MPVSIAASGSQTATLDTDHTLVTQAGPTGGGHFQLLVDTANLVNGERLILTLQVRVRGGDTTRTVYQSVYRDAQADPIKVSPSVAVPVTANEVTAVLRQEGGTGRAYPWALYRLDA